jgi:hypothetical protein
VTRPQPVITAASVTSMIKAVVSVLALLGFNEASLHLSAMTTSIVAVVIGVYELAPHILVALHVRSQVTPIADPKTGTGEPLVPVSAVKSVVVQNKAAVVAAVDSDIDDTPIPLDPELEDDVASEDTSTGHVAEHAG